MSEVHEQEATVLIDQTRSSDEWQVYKAVCKLDKLRDAPGVSERIIELISHTSAQVRRVAVVSLEDIYSSAAKDALTEALKDEAPNVRIAAKRALSRHEEHDEEVRQAAIRKMEDEAEAELKRVADEAAAKAKNGSDRSWML